MNLRNCCGTDIWCLLQFATLSTQRPLVTPSAQHQIKNRVFPCTVEMCFVISSFINYNFLHIFSCSGEWLNLITSVPSATYNDLSQLNEEIDD